MTSGNPSTSADDVVVGPMRVLLGHVTETSIGNFSSSGAAGDAGTVHTWVGAKVPYTDLVDGGPTDEHGNLRGMGHHKFWWTADAEI